MTSNSPATAANGGRSSDPMRLIGDRVRSRTRAIIFDLDGVIALTERFHWAALNNYLGEFGCALTDDQLVQLVGVDNPTMAQLVTEWCSLSITTEAFTEGRMRAVLPLLRKDLKPAPGLLPLLDFLDERGISLAVASNSPRAYVLDVLAILGVFDRFGCVRAGGDVPKGKPAPDVYLAASGCLGVQADQCMSVEDSPAGVESALASGMISVLIPNGVLEGKQFPQPDLCFSSLTDLLDWLRSILDEEN